LGELAQPSPTAAPIPDDERALWNACRAEQSAEAREALFARYLPLARRVAWRFMRNDPATPLEYSELLQLASVGLLEAIDRFNPDLAVPFRYYCSRRIAGAIVDGVGKLSEVNEQISTRRQIERERLRSMRQDAPAPEGLEAKLALIGDVAAELAIGLMLEDSAMFVGDEPRDPAKDAYETLAWKQAVQQLIGLLDGLPERERSVIRYHYLEGLRFEQIARLLELSRGRISQLHKAGIALLRRRLSDTNRFWLKG
jgi:RNA polymerase sigma factor for flagellar operon FliA